MANERPHQAEVIRYHLSEARIVAAPFDPRRSVPTLLPGDRAILDIGCGIGQTLTAPEFLAAERRCGVDIDAVAIAYGKQAHGELDICVAPAEQLPFPDNQFDLVYSRVALPYTNLPLAIGEAYRVLKSGGRVWISLHPPAMLHTRLLASIIGLRLKSIIDVVYIAVNSLLFIAVGRCVARPWSGQYESVQTIGSMARAMRKVGFEAVQGSASDFALCIEARKP